MGAGSMANSDMNTTLNAIERDLSSTATHLRFRMRIKYRVTDQVVPKVYLKSKEKFSSIMFLILKRNFCSDVNKTWRTT